MGIVGWFSWLFSIFLVWVLFQQVAGDELKHTKHIGIILTCFLFSIIISKDYKNHKNYIVCYIRRLFILKRQDGIVPMLELAFSIRC